MLVALGLVVVLLLIYLYCVHYKPTFEQFTNIKPSLEEEIMKVYADLLDRTPTPTELKKHLLELKTGQITIDGLQQRVLDSDEYERLIKLQSNDLAPELRKMVYEKNTLSYLSRVYGESTGRAIPPKFILPLRDIFIYIDYNDIALRLFLKSPMEEEFEKELLNTFQLNKETTLDMFEKTFPKADLLREAKTRLQGQVSSIQDPPPQVQREGVANTKNAASIQEPSLLLTKPNNATIEGFTSKIVVEDQDAPFEIDDLSVRNEWRKQATPLQPPQPVDGSRMFESFVGSVSMSAMEPASSTILMGIQEAATKIFNKDEAAKILDQTMQI